MGSDDEIMLPFANNPQHLPQTSDTETDDEAVLGMFNLHPRPQINLPDNVRPVIPPDEGKHDGSEDSDNDVDDIPLPFASGDVRQRFINEAQQKQQQEFKEQQEEKFASSSRPLPTKVNIRRLRTDNLFEDEEVVVLSEIQRLQGVAERLGRSPSGFRQDELQTYRLRNLAQLNDAERMPVIARILKRHAPKAKPRPKPRPSEPEEGKHDDLPPLPDLDTIKGTKRKREDEVDVEISRGRRKRQNRRKPQQGTKRQREDEVNVEISRGRRKRPKRPLISRKV
jgi:hypothetical protein